MALHKKSCGPPSLASAFFLEPFSLSSRQVGWRKCWVLSIAFWIYTRVPVLAERYFVSVIQFFGLFALSYLSIRFFGCLLFHITRDMLSS